MNVTIRRAAPEDAETLARFGERLAQESEGKALDPRAIRAGVRSVFEQDRDAFYLIAEAEGGDAAGSLMVTTEWSDWRDGFFWWIQSVYVRPEWRRRGVYRRLHERVRTMAEDAGGVCGLRLYVEQENDARAAYEALGMRRTRYRMYEVELPGGERGA